MRPQPPVYRAGSIRTVLAVVVLGASASAQIPDGYYDSVDTTNATTLRQTLHAVIDDHQRFPYTSGATDTWDILELAQQDPSNSNNIIDIYQNDSHPKQGGGNSLYNREHSWPNSYGFPNDGSGNYPFTDCHTLFLCDPSYNTSRSNKPFRNCGAACTERPTVLTNGVGGGTGVYPGNSNWTTGQFTQGTWEVWMSRRGDIARAQLYMDVRYEGGNHGITGFSEPDLILTNNEGLIDNSNTGNNESVAYMGMLSTLLIWHFQDPVDDWERNRNDVIFGFQGNRNPFVDHPEWVSCLFQNQCPASTVYCTSKVNSDGCAPAIGFTGTPSASAGSGYVITATEIVAGNNGLFFYSKTGDSNLPFQGGFLCIAAPATRTPGQNSGGSGLCGGSFNFDFNAYIASGADPGLVAGASFWGQYWSRDPASPSTTNLTNAVGSVIGP